ncbi:probable E3 ubiquitin-protein ligase bre1 [Acanthaster planci]|uniref:Probable E3 ubiquitin-protein ligase bre1 n=1 Tax=Acanthaster planci TaxID=133434 RepID=A0A8B7Y2K8_ACAPL|nr:probable E3 ubiquitin-protein ligase bre1 [Acanthaster planci]
MAHLVSQSTTQLQLNPQELALFIAQQANTQAALDRRNEAFKKLVVEVQTSKEDAERYRQKARYLELDVARTDAHLAKMQQSFAQEQQKNAKLTARLDEVQRGEKIFDRCRTEEEEEEGRMDKIYPHGEIHKPHQRTNKDQHKGYRGQRGDEQTNRAAPFQALHGVSYEHHELLLQQMVRMKQELTRLAEKNGQDVDKILEAARYKEIIEKLQEDIQEKANENEQLLEKIQQLCTEDEGPMSEIVKLQFMNEKLQKKLNLSQVMIDTLSKRCEELKEEHKKAAPPNQKEDGHAPDDSKVFVPIHKEEKTESATEGQDMVDGGVSVKQLEQQNKRLNDEMGLLDTQLKQVTADNKLLVKERQDAEKQREIFEQRYNELMQTLQDIQQKQRQCSKCRSLELEITKLRREMTDLKDINELVQAQMKLYEEDLRQEQMEAASQKQKNNFHIEQWKKNCQRMGQQVDLLTADLRKEREEIRKLKYQLSVLKSQGGRPAMSLAANFANSRCAPLGPKSSPWQEGFHDIEIDGPGVDVPDVGQDMSDSMGEFLSASSHDLGSDSSRYRSVPTGSFLLSNKPLECPRCKREYPADRLEEFQRHVNKCIDSS